MLQVVELLLGVLPKVLGREARAGQAIWMKMLLCYLLPVLLRLLQGLLRMPFRSDTIAVCSLCTNVLRLWARLWEDHRHLGCAYLLSVLRLTSSCQSMLLKYI